MVQRGEERQTHTGTVVQRGDERQTHTGTVVQRGEERSDVTKTDTHTDTVVQRGDERSDAATGHGTGRLARQVQERRGRPQHATLHCSSYI